MSDCAHLSSGALHFNHRHFLVIDRACDHKAELAVKRLGAFIGRRDGQAHIAAHTAFLQDWIAAENPRWEVWWAIANDGANADGAMEEWLATGNIVTTTGADGTESRAYETIDVLLEGGKIKALNVASQTMPE